jgi:hypothetical protein
MPLSRIQAALAELCVEKWLTHIHVEVKHCYRSTLKGWLLWLWLKSDWFGKMPSELLTFQEEANGRQRFILPDLMIDYIQEKGGTYSSMTTQHSHLRTFFTHNRVELPPIGNWQPNPTKEPAKGNLNFDQVRQIILHADPRDQAIFVTMLQGLMDLERFTKFNRKYAGALVRGELRSSSSIRDFQEQRTAHEGYTG